MEPIAMAFFRALENAITSKNRIARMTWDSCTWVELQYPHVDKLDRMTRPYLFLHDASGNRIPWLPSMEDIFAEDWVIE